MIQCKDGLWLLTIRKGQAFVPTMACTQAGFYMGIDPVEVLDASDQAAVEQAMLRVINRGNPVVPTPARDSFPESPLLKYAGVRSHSAFEKSAQTWKLSKKEGVYFICPYQSSKYGGSEEDSDRMEAIPDDVPLESVVRRLVDSASCKTKN